MGQILSNWRVIFATFFSVALIFAASILARNIESPAPAEASAETALLQAITSKDSDGDGLPDWGEALYGTDPHKVDTFGLGMTDGEAVAKGLIVPKAVANVSVATSSPVTMDDNGLPPPAAEGTLTAAFAKNFFSLYMSAKGAAGGDLSESEIADITNKALESLSGAVMLAPDYKSAHDLTISGTGPAALTTFAANAEAVFLANKNNATTSELEYLKAAVLHDDTTASTHLALIAKGYRNAAAGLVALPIPPELAANDLALINALMRLSEIINDFSRVNDDPLAAILALQQYATTVLSLGSALSDIGATYKAAGVFLTAGTPGAQFIDLVENIPRVP